MENPADLDRLRELLTDFGVQFTETVEEDSAGGECDCGGDPIYLHHEGSPPLDMTGTKVEETLHRIHRELESALHRDR